MASCILDGAKGMNQFTNRLPDCQNISRSNSKKEPVLGCFEPQPHEPADVISLDLLLRLVKLTGNSKGPFQQWSYTRGRRVAIFNKVL